MEQYVKYLRKSRFDRDYAEFSVEETLKRHEAILDKLASDRGYSIAKTYYEVVSGESIAARPEIQKMLAEVGDGIYAGVLVVDVERLARGNGADQAYISQIFQFSGTKIITPLKVYDPSNEYDEEYFEFGLFMSRREYKTINRRLIRGRQSSASEGKYLGSIAPYGYRRVKLPDEKGYSLEPEPEEADVVKQVFDMYLHGDGTKVIANYLNDRRVPTRHGELWTYSSIFNMLKNPVYCGKIRRGWCKQIKKLENGVVKKHIKHLQNPEDYQIFQGLHPPLISEEVFQDAQRVRIEKPPAAPVKDEFELQNAFAGLIYCSVCGKRIGRTTNRGIPRLRCVNHRNCHNASYDYAQTEEQIIGALRTWVQGYKVKIDHIGFENEIETFKAQIEQLRCDRERLGAQLENACELVEQGLYTRDEFRRRKEKLTGSMEEIDGQISAITEKLSSLENRDDFHANLIPQTEALLASYDQMTVAERNRLLKEILYKIEYRKETKGALEIDLFPKLPRL